MSKRLQVILDESEFRALRREARRRKMTVAAFVRHAIRAAQRQESPEEAKLRKLAAIERAATFSAPAPDIDQMLREIEQGDLGHEAE